MRETNNETESLGNLETMIKAQNVCVGRAIKTCKCTHRAVQESDSVNMTTAHPIYELADFKNNEIYSKQQIKVNFFFLTKYISQPIIFPINIIIPGHSLPFYFDNFSSRK